MLKGLYHNYWQFGFKTRLYDLLTPWAYRDSIAGCVESLQLKNGERVLDAGCGSGQGFERIINECPGVRYVGMDILEQGLQAGREKASRFNGSIRSSWVRADLGADAPFKGGTFDKILAHFSVYTLSDKNKRRAAWASLYEVLAPGGVLVAANPSTTYDAGRIIGVSRQHLAHEKRGFSHWVEWVAYSLTGCLGLRHIQKQLECDHWHAYSLEELEAELIEAGFKVSGSNAVYADSGWRVVATRKPF